MDRKLRRGTSDDEDGDTFLTHWLLVALMAVSIALSGVGLALPLAEFNVDTMVGITTLRLDSEFDARSVTYTGSAEGLGVDVSGETVYLEGLGEFQEKVGFLKGTAKERTNTITPYTTGTLGNHANLSVRVRTETIPWWAVGVKVPCAIDVELLSAKNVSTLTIDRVWFEFRRQVDGRPVKKVVWEDRVSHALKDVGDVRTYEAELEATEDWGEFELFGMVNVTMVDTDGVTATEILRPGSKVIALWTVPVGQTTRIALLITAMPVIVTGMVLGVVAILLAVLRRRRRLPVTASAATLLLLGPLFFRIGLNELSELVGYPDDVAYHWGWFLAMTTFIPAMVATALLSVEAARRSRETGEDGPSEVIEARPEGPATPEDQVPAYGETDMSDQDVEEEV